MTYLFGINEMNQELIESTFVGAFDGEDDETMEEVDDDEDGDDEDELE